MAYDDVLEQLRLWHVEARERVDTLNGYRQRVQEQSGQLESPGPVVDYINFFVEFFTRAADELQRVAAELPAGLQQAHLDTLRQLASNAAVEQRRCVMFRDKWINRPLPFEQVRPLLNQLSIDTRDQLSDFRQLNEAAERLAGVAGRGTTKSDAEGLDRRALFQRLLGGRDKTAGRE